ncbi:MAG: ROK family transcriptional regulator [Syntrophomonadaceae bacterium]|nr:ROK family transcriptional regulator [Syntrophomonadaceae bacterium]
MNKNPGNSKYVKKLNRMTVLNIIKEHEPICRQQLSKITGLTPPAITAIVRELVDLGLIKEEGLGASNGGRKPVKLKFNPRAGLVIGLEVTRYEVNIGIADLKNDPMKLHRLPLDMSNPHRAVLSLAKEIDKVMNSDGMSKNNFMGIGVAFPGLLMAKEGIIKRSVNLGPEWNNFPIKDVLEREVGLSVFVEHNSNASVLAERWFGKGTDSRNLVYVNLGEGISAGVIMDDRIVQGFQGHAGEIGHVVIMSEGPLCNCGNRGCLESICGALAVVRTANEELPVLKREDALKDLWEKQGKVTIEDIIKQSEIEGSYAWQLIRQVGRFVGVAIAGAINLYNPEAVFVGGKLAAAGEVLLRPLQEAVKTHAFPEIARATRVELSGLGKNAATIGACALALRELFRPSQAGILAEAAITSERDRGATLY